MSRPHMATFNRILREIGRQLLDLNHARVRRIASRELAQPAIRNTGGMRYVAPLPFPPIQLGARAFE